METTFNMRTDILDAISRAARKCHMTRSQVIICLIKKVMADVPEAFPMGAMVRYQERRRPEDWRVVHVWVSVYEYEYMMDLRKLLKMSVSLICAYAIEKYLMKPSKRYITDNYPYFMNYMVVKEMIKNIISWRIIWGITPDLNEND
jgi:hypothetical protein